MFTKLKKIQIMTKFKISNCDKTLKLKLFAIWVFFSQFEFFLSQFEFLSFHNVGFLCEK